MLFLYLGHFLGELLLPLSDGLLLGAMNFFSLAVALNELVFQQGQCFLHSLQELALFLCLGFLLLLENVLQFEVFSVL